MGKSLIHTPPGRLRLALYCACGLVGAAIAAIGVQRGTAPPPRPALDVTLVDLNLGEVWLQRDLEFSVPIHNTTASAIEVSEISASCNCAELSDEPFTVAAGASHTITGKIDLFRSVHDPARDSSPFEVSISVVTASAPKQSFSWPLNGVAKRFINLDPPAISLYGANEVISGTYSPLIDVMINSPQPLSAIDVECAAELGVATITTTESNVYRLEFVPNIDLPCGKVDSGLRVKTRLENGQSGPDLLIPVEGIVSAPVRLAPAHLTLSSGNKLTADTHILGFDAYEWRVQQIDNCPDWLAIEPSDAGTLSVTLMQPPPAETKSATINVVVESSAHRLETLPLAMTCIVTSPSD